MNSPEKNPAAARIVFVCTGNIFRSLSAEYGARAFANRHPDLSRAFNFSSAGTHTRPHRRLRADILAAIAAHGQIDAAAHASRPLDAAIVRDATLLVALDQDHQDYIRRTFNRHAPLYLEIARGVALGIPDLPDIVPDYKTNPAAAAAGVDDTVRRIIRATPRFLQNLPHFLPPAPGARAGSIVPPRRLR